MSKRGTTKRIGALGRQSVFLLQKALLCVVSRCGFTYASGFNAREWTYRLPKSREALTTTPERQDTLLVLIIRV